MSAPFTPEAAPVAGEPAQPAAGGEPGQGHQEPQSQAASPDPRVLEQMQSQMQQFGGTLNQMAEYLPALQQIAGQQQEPGGGEPTLEELAAQFFGDPNYGQEPQGEPRFDPYTGEPVQAQQQPQGGMQGDPNALIQMFQRVVQSEVAPLQERLQREDQERVAQQWQSLYKEFPQFNDPQVSPQIAESVAQAARLFGRTPEEAQQYAQNPTFVRMAYLASVNEAQARGESPAGASDGPNPIESGNGASVGGGQEIDPGDDIVNAGRGGTGAAAGSHFR